MTGQFGAVASSLSPAVPEKVLTTGTPINAANLMVFLSISSLAFASTGSGEIGLLWQLNALMVKFLFFSSAKYAARFSSLSNSSSVGQ
ncbi:hypothetical protein SDC9_84574 [bioreactor metagenome]|uniref:Uncharacterized protein n=1 Tax=bioreactor metagenome TaxID=1076179 RepID=A0A644ZAP7_9ZZZZ